MSSTSSGSLRTQLGVSVDVFCAVGLLRRVHAEGDARMHTTGSKAQHGADCDDGGDAALNSSSGAMQDRTGSNRTEKTDVAAAVVKVEAVASTSVPSAQVPASTCARAADGAGKSDKGALLMLDLEQDRRLSKVDSIVVSILTHSPWW